MSEVKSAWRDAASVVARATEHTDHPEQAVGLIRQISLHEGDGEAQVMFGFTPDLIPIASTNWFRVFADQVRAGDVTGQRVLVSFVSRQPVILGLMGA